MAFDFGQIHMRGGFLNKAMPMVCRVVRDIPGNCLRTFVKISSNEAWLCKAACDHTQWKFVLATRGCLLVKLKDLVLKAANGELDSASSEYVADGIDRGDGILESESPKDENKPRVSGRKHMRYGGAHEQIFTTLLPERPEEEEGIDQPQRKITLYIEDRITVWLALEDVEWAVRYMFLQYMLKGVPLVSADSTGPCGRPDGCSRSSGHAPEMTGK